MVRICDKCRKPSIHFIRYSGQHLCGDHFLDLIRRRVKKEMRSQRLLHNGRKIAVAVSGGKDSLLALKLTHEVSSLMKDIELFAITIDEGIEGYRPSSIDITRDVTDELGIELMVRSYEDLFSIPLDDMVERSDMGPCSICGILRRKAMNNAAMDADCNVLVTGHNLDDMAQTVLMNVMQADVGRLSRLGPHLDPLPGFIPRSIPLRTTPETETYLSAVLMGLPIHELECPYSIHAKRGHYRDLLMRAEEETPGTRHSLLRFNDQVSSLIPKENAFTTPCERCGDPVINSGENTVCRACSLLDILEIEI